MILVDAECDADKTKRYSKSQVVTCKVIGTYINPRSFVEKAGHLIPVSQG